LIFASQALISGANKPGTFNEMNDTTQAPSSEPNAPSTAPEPDGFAVIEKLNAENAELKDRVLRALADVENMRRRSERESADARAYAVTAFARELLTVADNLARALENVPAEARAETDGPLKTLVEGVELTERELQAVLGRHGVKKLEPRGEKFDPNFHQAMFEVPNETLPAGTVTEVVQSGWKIGERVLRPALVGVSKGGPKTAPAKAD
jgi:molecular chaperone GrpE